MSHGQKTCYGEKKKGESFCLIVSIVSITLVSNILINILNLRYKYNMHLLFPLNQFMNFRN